MIYETLAATPDGSVYLCRRSLIEIKTPYKLRKRQPGEPFYPMTTLSTTGRQVAIPLAYYDQIQGNMRMMGLGLCYFVVLSPSGYQVQVEPLDLVYTDRSLFPSLDRFCNAMLDPRKYRKEYFFCPGLHSSWHEVVIPAFQERDALGSDNVYAGWMPSASTTAL